MKSKEELEEILLSTINDAKLLPNKAKYAMEDNDWDKLFEIGLAIQTAATVINVAQGFMEVDNG